MINAINSEAGERMKKSIESLSHSLAKLRTGRAHPSLLEGVSVEYYGNSTPLNQVASVTVTDSQTLSVTPYEKSMVPEVDKAIRNADLGLNPAVAGQVIRVPLPPLTEERRIALTKQVKAEVETARIAIRNIRRDANTQIKTLLKDKDITEDEERKGQDDIQKLTDKHISEVEKIAQEKETDLMKV